MSFTFAGNERTLEIVNEFINARRIPHALLIYGAKGTGRHTLCRYIVNAAVCTGVNPPCGECKECTVFAHDNHPDIIKIAPLDGKKNIAVSQIRELKSSALVKPHMNGKKVFIIDPADFLNEQAQNALLKILEEPPQDVIFLLIAENASSLLDTINSRCVKLELTVPSLEEALEYISAQTDYQKEDILNAVKTANSNIGDALEILGSNEASLITPAEDFCKLLFANAGSYELLKTVYPLEKSRKDCEAFIKELKSVLTKRIRLECGNQFLLSRMMRFYEIVSQSEKSLVTNVNLSLYLTALVCKLKENY
ncbi:MAG: DNA polymerase III subunit [Clostridiales bacterium]|nr:DNA polymerase III subunit [Candidatus Equinaster intestinalis]